MWNKLENVFIQTGYPYHRQGSFQEGEEIPESVFTFWNNDTPEDGFFDNKANRAVWVWYVYFYTRDASKIYYVMDDFIEKAKAEGFIPQGKAHDIPSDEPDYFGRFVALKFIENYSHETGKNI